MSPDAAGCSWGCDNPDAGLIQLGAKLDVLERERAAIISAGEREWAEIEAEAERRTGIARRNAPDLSPADDPNGWWSVVDKICHERNADDEDENGDTKWGRFYDRLSSIMGAILSQQATTLEGLKIQARAVAIAASDLWDGEPDNTHEMRFIGSACAFFGMNAKQIALAGVTA
jgi:hypothetical protein